MRTRILALVFTAALAACQPGQDRRPQKAQARRASAVAAVQVPPVAHQLADVDRLRIDLPWTGPAALRAPRVDVTSPRGLLYAQLPVEVQPDGSGGGTATAMLEVRGTPIDGYHLVGTWRFALVDGGGPPLAIASIDLE